MMQLNTAFTRVEKQRNISKQKAKNFENTDLKNIPVTLEESNFKKIGKGFSLKTDKRFLRLHEN